MRPALDSATLDRLISLGRERGHLTTEDLRTSLPIESMSAEEIALIVVHLEGTGVPVEFEESLLSSNPKPMPRKSAEIIPFPESRANRSRSKGRSLQPIKSTLPEPRQATMDGTPFMPWIVAAAGAIAFAVLSLIIFVMMG